MIIKTKIDQSGEQLCIYNWLPNKDDFWVFGQAFYTDYYVIHEPIAMNDNKARIGIVPTERNKKPKPRDETQVPTTDINSTASNTVLI